MAAVKSDKWRSTLKQEKKDAAYHEKRRTHNASKIQSIAKAAEAFISANKSHGTKLQKLDADYDAIQRAMLKNLKTLADLEKELEAAKKKKDSAKVKQIEAKMKPLEKAHERDAAKHSSMEKSGTKDLEVIGKALTALEDAVK